MLPPPFQRWSMTSASLLRFSRSSFLEPAQRRLVHRLDVQVADRARPRACRPSRAARLHPTLVAKLAVRRLETGSMRVFQAPSSVGLVLNVTSTLRLRRWLSSSQ